MTILYRLFYTFGTFVLTFLYPLNKKIKTGWELRRKQNGLWPWLKGPAATRPIWIHCASGEFEYALPLIRTIKKHTPNQRILVTYHTGTYLKRIEQEPLVDFVSPAPWDTPKHVREFLDFHKPRALLFSRTDVWFELTRQCSKQNIPVAIFSMTFNKNPRGFVKMFLRWQMQFINHFFVVSKEDRDNLSRLIPGAKISVTGDTRYEQCLQRLSLHLPIKVNSSAITKKVFIAGSTWPEDEDVLVPFMARNQERCHWVIVPHEIHADHIRSLQAELERQGLRSVLYSQVDAWNMDGVLIVDTVGVLAHLYKIADFTFIGGSYKKQVHSVMESLACGCLTYVGPHYTNNREAIEFSKPLAGFAVSPVQVSSGDKLDEVFLATQNSWNATLADRLRALVASKARASEALYEEIFKRM